MVEDIGVLQQMVFLHVDMWTAQKTVGRVHHIHFYAYFKSSMSIEVESQCSNPLCYWVPY